MLEDETQVDTDPVRDPDETGAARRAPRRSATRAAGPPPTVANPFLNEDADASGNAAPPAVVPPPAAAPGAPFAAIFQTPELTAIAAAKEAEPPPVEDQPAATGSQRSRRRSRGSGRARPEAGDGEGDAGGQVAATADEAPTDGADPAAETATDAPTDSPDQPATKRRRRRRRGGGGGDTESQDDDPNTVVKVRAPREVDPTDRVTGVKGSTRLEAKRQRRREGREAGRRRAPILSEAEFLARREAVERDMVVRQRDDVTQIAVLEDGVLVEHYVTRDAGAPASGVGNVYLGRVQNVLPSMEAAFVDIGRGRNGVLYAGEVNWDAAGLEGQHKRIELALKSGDSVLVQVTKDPIGHKGARLTSQVSLPGRFLVLVPDGSMTGISRKLPDTERTRLRGIIRANVPEGVGVIVRTAAEGAAEEEIVRDILRLTHTWEEIKRKAASASPPQLLHGEPDLAIRVVRDIFNEDFTSLRVEGDQAWEQISSYLAAVAPDLAERSGKWNQPEDCFTHHRIDEQLAKALDRKVWLPSGGSLIIEPTEAMTVIDVNTGKFTGQGGDLEETVTQNNLEAAEEIVRQIRLRDIGGIIIIDFIDMVLTSNQDLVLRRLVECLGRDRTKHQVTEITSLGLAQMTRKRIGGGLLETFSEPCEACNGRGIRIQLDGHGLPGNGRRRPVKPTGAHDPVEMMQKSRPTEESPEVPEPAVDTDAHASESVSEQATPQPEPQPGPEQPEAAPEIAAEVPEVTVAAVDTDAHASESVSEQATPQPEPEPEQPEPEQQPEAAPEIAAEVPEVTVAAVGATVPDEVASDGGTGPFDPPAGSSVP